MGGVHTALSKSLPRDSLRCIELIMGRRQKGERKRTKGEVSPLAQGTNNTLPRLLFPLTADSAEKVLEYVTGTTPHRQDPVSLCSLRGTSSMGSAFTALDCLSRLPWGVWGSARAGMGAYADFREVGFQKETLDIHIRKIYLFSKIEGD